MPFILIRIFDLVVKHILVQDYECKSAHEDWTLCQWEVDYWLYPLQMGKPTWMSSVSLCCLTQSAGAVEYTDCISVRLPNKCPRYDAKQSDGEAPVMLELW